MEAIFTRVLGARCNLSTLYQFRLRRNDREDTAVPFPYARLIFGTRRRAVSRSRVSKSVGKNTTVLRKINEAKTLFPPAFCLLPSTSSQLQIFTPFYLILIPMQPDLVLQIFVERASCPFSIALQKLRSIEVRSPILKTVPKQVPCDRILSE
jgi:hypothetical protein